MSIQNPTIGYIIVGILIFIIIAINISLFSALRNKNSSQSVNLYKSAFVRAKSPWQPEDEALLELSKLTKDLSSSPTDKGTTDNHEKPIKN
jgi:hypothetical protein